MFPSCYLFQKKENNCNVTNVSPNHQPWRQLYAVPFCINPIHLQTVKYTTGWARCSERLSNLTSSRRFLKIYVREYRQTQIQLHSALFLLFFSPSLTRWQRTRKQKTKRTLRAHSVHWLRDSTRYRRARRWCKHIYIVYPRSCKWTTHKERVRKGRYTNDHDNEGGNVV